MGDLSKSTDVDKLISFGNDLVGYLRDNEDFKSLKLSLEQSKNFQSHCDADLDHVHNSIKEYERKIDLCKQKMEEAKADVAPDSELDLIEKQLEELLKRESLMKEELRVITEEINNLEHQRVFVEEQKQILKRLEQDDLQEERKLSMYASVTKIIPNLDDDTQISGCIVEKNQNLVEKFEFDRMKVTSFDTCNAVWEMMKL